MWWAGAKEAHVIIYERPALHFTALVYMASAVSPKSRLGSLLFGYLVVGRHSFSTRGPWRANHQWCGQ